MSQPLRAAAVLAAVAALAVFGSCERHRPGELGGHGPADAKHEKPFVEIPEAHAGDAQGEEHGANPAARAHQTPHNDGHPDGAHPARPVAPGSTPAQFFPTPTPAGSTNP